MFKPKNALISMAVVALLAACGGGGGGDGKLGGGSDAGGNNPPAGQPGGTQTKASTEDAKLATTFESANQVVLGDGAGYRVFPASDAFISKTPRVADPANGVPEGYGLYAQKRTANAPLQSIGINTTLAGNSVVENGTGRVGFELKDQAEAQQEILRIQVDKVNYTIADAGASGKTVTATIPADAKVYVYAKNAAGGIASVSVSAATTPDLVKVVNSVGGAGSVGQALVLDVDKAVAAAVAAASAQDKTVLQGVKDFRATTAEPFAVTLSFSNINLVTSPDNPAPLTVPDLTVDSTKIAGIKNGGGYTGYLAVDENSEEIPASPAP